MTDLVQNWEWMIAFFPMWALMSGLWFALASIPKKVAGERLRSLLDGAAVALSACSATAILITLNCETFIRLPFADPACHWALFS